MQVMLAYGRAGLAVELPDDRTDVVEPRDVPGLPDEPAAITAALRAPLGTLPLRALAGPDDDVVVVVNDGTRPKPVMPGLAGLATVLCNHGPRMIAHPGATFGVLEGNPIHEEQREIALRTQPTFSLNVALNKRHEITGVWAGEMMAAHAAGVAF